MFHSKYNDLKQQYEELIQNYQLLIASNETLAREYKETISFLKKKQRLLNWKNYRWK